MDQFEQSLQDYERVEQALQYLESNFKQQPSLSDIAAGVNLSEFHFQKVFSRWVGISPKRFLQYVTKEYAKQLLQSPRSLLDVTYDAGLSSPGRLYDLFVACEAITPGEYKEKGSGLTICYGFHPTPFGECLLSVTDRGICGLGFVKTEKETMLAALINQWPMASIVESAEATRPYIQQIFRNKLPSESAPLHLFVKGTNFQIKVWEALIRIPFGAAVTYEDIARHIGNPGAVRAVGTAIGKNPIPFLIPCHRVIRKIGEFGNYGEGPLRKKALLGWEAAKLHERQAPLVE
jgi:AraC family transcriptional regulator of adaptative response/methylated-DNA-[protein]-cysteine methyltransferase